MKPRHGILKVCDSPEISAKYYVCITFMLLFLKKVFRNFISVSKRSDIKKKSLRTTAALLDLTAIFLFVYVYINVVRSSHIHTFRLLLPSFWSHIFTIIYQNKLPVVDLVLPNNREEAEPSLSRKRSVNLRWWFSVQNYEVFFTFKNDINHFISIAKYVIWPSKIVPFICVDSLVLCLSQIRNSWVKLKGQFETSSCLASDGWGGITLSNKSTVTISG